MPQQRRDSGLTEYIARGELVEENDSTDYRELIRAARQQRAETLHAGPGTPGAASSYAARALTAYQANSEIPATAGQRPGIDELV